MTTYDKLQKEFDAKVKRLRESCKHPKISEWRDFWWAPGHSTGSCVKVCEICGKIVEEKKHLEIPLSERPFIVLPNDMQMKIFKLQQKDKMSFEEARKKVVADNHH